jgi:hypothetical protein
LFGLVEWMDVGHHRPGQLSTAEAAQARGKRRLGLVSMVLIAVGLIGVIRLLISGKRPARSPATDRP